jgi:hypothetical protein
MFDSSKYVTSSTRSSRYNYDNVSQDNNVPFFFYHFVTFFVIFYVFIQFYLNFIEFICAISVNTCQIRIKHKHV